MIIPDGIEPVVAFRSWYLGDAGTLLSMNHTAWPVRQTMEAKCERQGKAISGFTMMSGRSGTTMLIDFSEVDNLNDDGEQHTPGESCSCGIYAAKRIDLAMSYFSGPQCVIGEVYMWGKIIEGTEGWRSQYAYPKTLYFQTLQPSLLDFFGLDRDFPNYLAWKEYEKQRKVKEQDVQAPKFADYGVELKPATMKQIRELKL